jgi:hypothetical protein
MLLAPMAPLAASANRLEAADAARKSARTGAVDKKKKPTAREALERSLFVDPLPAGSPVISATLQDSIVDTSPADGLADPGSIVTYKAVITNNGNTDLTNVSYKDVIDPNTTLINGSIKMAPLARNDSYNTSQDTQLVVAAGSGVLANDSGTPAPTAVVITAFATAHGTVDNLNSDGSFKYTPASGYMGLDSFTYTATNGQPPDGTATVSITVTAANSAPVLTAGATLNYTENDAATVIDNTITVTDSDSANLTGATAQITGNYQSTEDVLSFVNQLGITGSYNSANGTLTLTGTTTLANYQTALRAVKYNNSSENPSAAARTVTWIATDGITPSAGVTSTINVTAVNDAPVLANIEAGALAYNENDAATAVSSTITVSDADSTNLTGATVQITGNYQSAEDVLSFVDQLGITGSYNSGTGTMTLSGTTTVANYQTALRAVKYNNTSENPNTLARTVTFQVNDGAGANNLSNTPTRNINVASVNDAPVVTAGATLSYTENDAATVIDNTVTVTDVDSTNLTGATVQITGSYASTEDVLSFANQLGITGGYNSANGTLTLTGTTTLANYQTALRAVKYNNTSDNPSTLARTVTWIVNDGAAANNLSTGVTSTINVTAVNDAPVLAAIEGSALAYTENDAATAVSSTITVNDVDSANLTGATVQITGSYQSAEDVLSFVTQNGISGSYNSANGTMTLSGSSSVSNYQTALRAVKYNDTSDAPSTLARTVTFQVNDGAGANNLSNTQTRNINVTAVNDAPVLANIEVAAVSYNENDPATAVSSTITVTDADSANLTSATVQITGNYQSAEDVLSFATQNGITGSYNSANGTMTLSGSSSVINYQAALRSVNYNNTSDNPSTLSRTVTFRVNDGAGVNNLSNTQTRNINVASVNDAPVLANIEGSALAYTENAAATAVSSTITVNDVDSTNLASATVQITGNYASAEDVLSFATQNGITGSYNSTNGTMTLSGASSVVNYQTALRAVKYNNTSDNPSTSARTVTFQVNDGGGLNNLSNTPTRNINVTSVNDAPVVDLNGTGTGGINTTATFTEDGGAIVMAGATDVTDVDNSNLVSATITLTNRPDGALESLSVDTTGTLITADAYVPGTGVLFLHGTDTLANYQQVLRTAKYNNTDQDPDTTARLVNFKGNDGATDSAVATATITVIAVNDAPVLAAIEGGNLTYTENDAATSITASMTVADIDSPTLSSATITISNNFQSGQDVLSFTNAAGMGNIAVQSNVGGVLTLTSAGNTATVANWQTALRAVKYSNSSDDPNTSARTVTFQVNDAGAVNNLSNTQTRNITVVAVNDPPTAFGFSALPAQAGIPIAYPAGKLGGTDVEAGTTVTIDTVPINVINGTVVINANGSFTFTPASATAGGSNNASFQYRVYDNGNPSGGPSPAGGVFGSYVTVSFNPAGPPIYFVRNPTVGLANCTLGNECSLATAVTKMNTDGAGATAIANAVAFIEDANTHTPGTITLGATGQSIIGQGVVAASFDSFFGIGAPAQGTLAARPAVNQTRPTISGAAPITAHNSTSLRGFNYAPSGNGLIAASRTNLVVGDMNISSTSNTGGQFAVNFTSSTGTFTFGPISVTGSGGGVNFGTTTSGSTVSFNDITTSTGPAFQASSTGATNFTFNDVTSTSGRAVDLNTGTGAFTFRKISSNGGTTGVSVQSITGSFTVNGTSTTAGTGGTIQSASSNGMKFTGSNNITLKNMNLTNNATSQSSTNTACGNNLVAGDTTLCTANLYLSTVTTITLNNLSISGSTQEGIAGTTVSALTLTNSTLSGNGNEDYEDGLLFKNLTGTVTITSTNVQNNFSRQAHIYNDTGSLTFNVTGSSFGRTIAPLTSSQQGLLMELHNSAHADVNIGTTSIVKNGNGNGLAITAVDSSTLGSSGTHSSLHDSTSLSENGAHVFISTGSNGVAFFDTVNNTVVTKAGLQSIDYFVGPNSTASGSITGVISGNTIGTTGVVGSACNRAVTLGGCDGMTIDKDGAGALSLRIQSNIIQQVETNGIALGTTQSNALNASIISNTIREPGYSGGGANAQGNALLFNVGANSGSTTTACLNIGGAGVQNIIQDTASKTWDINGIASSIYFNTKNATVTRQPGYAGASTDNAAFAAYTTSRNTFNLTGGAAPTSSTRFNGSTYGGGAACSVPLLLAEGGVESALNSPSLLSTFELSALAPAANGSRCGASAAKVETVTAPSFVASLDQQQVDSMVAAAIERWTATGLTAGQIGILRGIKFDVTDLGGAYLGESSNSHVQLDRNAGGKGWYIGADSSSDLLFSRAVSTTRRYTDPSSAPAGHLDLLTAIEHEMGHKLGLDDSYSEKDRNNLMYGYLTVGERRLPAPGQAQTVQSGRQGTQHLILRTASAAELRRAATPIRHADTPVTPLSGETVTVVIGTLPAGKSVTIYFQVTLNTAMPAGTNHVTTQGQVFYDSGPLAIANQDESSPGLGPDSQPFVYTDDPKVLPNTGETDPTVTPIDTPTASASSVGGQILDGNGNPVEGAAVRMTGSQTRLTVTDAAGNYHFDDVDTNGFYTVVPARSNFTFSPSQRAFSQLSQHTDAVFTATSTGTALNPLDTTEYFVRQQYVDFLGREPDESGLGFWVNNIDSCGENALCRQAKRIDTSAAFFLSIEFQQTGYLVYRTYQASFADMPGAPVPIKLSEFKPDTAEIGKNLVVNQSGWQTVLENNTQAYMTEFVQRPRFVSLFAPTLTPTAFVGQLFANAGVTPSDAERAAAVNEFGSAGTSSDVAARARALRRVAESTTLASQEFDQAFVLMQYFGYLRRDPNTGPDHDYSGFTFWLGKLDGFNGNFGDAEMVKSFLVSGEYRGRFPR